MENALDDLFHGRGSYPLAAPSYHRLSMLLALGGHFLHREISRGNWTVVVALVAAVLLLRYWPQVVDWVTRRWNSR